VKRYRQSSPKEESYFEKQVYRYSSSANCFHAIYSQIVFKKKIVDAIEKIKTVSTKGEPEEKVVLSSIEKFNPN